MTPVKLPLPPTSREHWCRNPPPVKLLRQRTVRVVDVSLYRQEGLLERSSSTANNGGAWRTTAIIFFGAACARLAVILLRPYVTTTPSELQRIAATFAHEGFLGNPYPLATGPTAHVAPGYALILGFLIRLLGSDAAGFRAGRILMALISAAVLALVPASARALGLPRRAGMATAIALAVPLFVWIETSGEWETPINALALELALIASIPTLKAGSFSVVRGLRQGMVWGVSLLFTPTIAAVYVAIHLIAAIRWRERLGSFFLYVVVSTATVVVIVAPYLARIERDLHGFAFIRDNLGLELAVSNNDSAMPAQNENLRRNAGMRTHPYTNRTETEKVRDLGELAYNKTRGDEAMRWIREHPSRFTTLTLQRIALFWIPECRWYQRILFVFAIMGAIGYVAQRFRDDTYHIILLAAIPASYSGIYSLIQADARYSYPILWFLLLLASEFSISVVGRFRPRHETHAPG